MGGKFGHLTAFWESAFGAWLLVLASLSAPIIANLFATAAGAIMGCQTTAPRARQ